MGVRVGFSGARRLLASVLVVALGGGGIVATASAAAFAADPPDWVEELEQAGSGDDIERLPWTESSSAPLVKSDGIAPAEVTFPDAATWDVELGGPGATAEVASSELDDLGVDSVSELPVQVASESEALADESLRVEVMGRDVAEQVGVSGLLVTLSDAGGLNREGEPSGGPLAQAAGAIATETSDERAELPAEVTIDYSGFAEAYGGDYASRLQVRAVPACALESPVPAGCLAAGVPLKVRNDQEQGLLAVEVDDLGALTGAGLASRGEDPSVVKAGSAVDRAALEGDPDFGNQEERVEAPDLPEGLEEIERSFAADPDEATDGAQAPEAAASTGAPQTTGDSAVVLAVSAAATSEQGSWAASPLSLSSSWSVGPATGEFSFSYPIDVPAPAGGSAPSVGLGYSSGSIDGLTSFTNTQAGQAGLGWSDFANAFIERHYQPCYEHQDNTVIYTSDLCWKNWNATISLGGVSGKLAPLDAEFREWRLEMGDPGWKIERIGDPRDPGVEGSHAGEYWQVTGPDGTRYTFGMHWSPDTGAFTAGNWWVPVFSDDPGEPCWDNGVGACGMAWRWNLERVEDPNGNVSTYFYGPEWNYYAALNGWPGGENTQYVRSGILDRIEYGARAGSSSPAAARVRFGRDERCSALSNCPVATTGNAASFPDVPNDQLCVKDENCTTGGRVTPTFFSTLRYTSVMTEVRVGSDWKPVIIHNVAHSFGENNDPTGRPAKKLQLEALQYVGVAFPEDRPNGPPYDAYPNTEFEYDPRANRADHDGNDLKAMFHARLIGITNPFGGRTDVSYVLNRICARDYQPPDGPGGAGPSWDLNNMNCFPQSMTNKDGLLETAIFYKYMVRQVVESPGRGSPAMTTSYSYEGAPAWAHDPSSFHRLEPEMGWTSWRGYEGVTITQGTSKTRVRPYRGMHNDKKMIWEDSENYCPCGRRDVDIRWLDDTVAGKDDPALVGRVLEEQQLGELDEVADVPLVGTRHTYEIRETAQGTRVNPRWSGESTTTERIAKTPTTFDERRSRMTYNDNQQLTSTLEEGWLHVDGDERCTITTYADNPAKNMKVYPAVNKLVAGQCDSTDVLSMSETYYDNNANLGAAPTAGNPTRQRSLIESERWSQTLTEFDTLGRPTKVTDPRGAETSTVYTSGFANGIPTKTTVTNALGHQSSTDWHPEFGVPRTETDVNGNLTTYYYDMYGRISTVWLPDAPFTYAQPSWQFSYDIPNGAVRSRQLVSDARTGSDVRFEDAWVITDGFGRERQSQGYSMVSGQALVTETTYDDRGLVKDQTVENAQPGAPGKYLQASNGWPNRTRSIYDELGRKVEEQWWRGLSTEDTTSTSYTVDTVTVTGPDGRQVRERVDGLGRTVAVEEHDGTDWVSSGYTFDLADRLLSVTDPEGSSITYANNLAGWRTSQNDPDRGSATIGYDDAGNQTSVADGSGHSVHTIYDGLGRQIERREGSSTGPLLAQWTYDTAPRGKGAPHKVITHDASGRWVSEVTGYDIRGRALGSKESVPTALAGIDDSYTTTQTYNRSGTVRSVNIPAIGGLPAETITTSYNDLGLPTGMTGASPYVRGVDYDSVGRKVSASYGAALTGGATWMAKHWSRDLDGRVDQVETFVAGSGQPNDVVSRHKLSWDPAGNVADKTTNLNGAEWRECFDYDQRSRMISAHTVDVASDCETGTPGTGANPYQQSYTYSPDGRLLTKTEGGTTTPYTYASPGSTQPHAPRQVGDEDYTWTAEGRLATRSVEGGTETFSWDVEGMLASVTGPEGETRFVYDASGQRVLRRSPDGSITVYVAGHEVTVDAAGTDVKAVRSYTFDGELVATRTTGSSIQYLVSDAAGSVEMATPSGGVPSATRVYDPYGGVRAESGDFETERGFVGQIEDASTGLSYMNARYYDTETGLFISTDPLYDTAMVKSLNPYGYSANNPTTFSDPSGLSPRAHMYSQSTTISALRAQNRQLVDHIKLLGTHIEQLQDVIRKQQNYINDLLTHIDALEAFIQQQAVTIRRLESRVRELEGVVRAQAREIGKLKTKIAVQAGIIKDLSGAVMHLGSAMFGFTKGAALALSIERGSGLANLKHEISVWKLGRQWTAQLHDSMNHDEWEGYEPGEPDSFLDTVKRLKDYIPEKTEGAVRAIGKLLLGKKTLPFGVEPKWPVWPGLPPLFVTNCDPPTPLCEEYYDEEYYNEEFVA